MASPAGIRSKLGRVPAHLVFLLILVLVIQPAFSLVEILPTNGTLREVTAAAEKATAVDELDFSHILEFLASSGAAGESSEKQEDDDLSSFMGEVDNDDSESVAEDDNSPRLDSKIENFDKARARACSPSTRADLIDHLQGSVDHWMGFLLGAMTSMESDPTALYDLLKGTGSVWDVLKSNFLFLLSVAAGLLVLLIYLLFCLPKLFCGCLGHLCCCSKCFVCKLTFIARVVGAVLLAAFALVGIVFGGLVFKAQSGGVSGAQQLYCQTYLFAEETLRGSTSLNTLRGLTSLDPRDTTSHNTEIFGGLLPLIDRVTSLVQLADKTNPKNFLEQAKEEAIEKLDVGRRAKQMEQAFNTLTQWCIEFSATNSLPGGFHKALWCEKTNPTGGDQELLKAVKRMTLSAPAIAQYKPSQHAEKLFEGISLPSLDIAGSFPVDTVKALFLDASNTLAETEGTISKLLRWLNVGLNIDCGFYVAFLILIILWSVWFFCVGTNARSITPAVLWNLTTWVVFVFLLFGGVLGWLMTAGRQGCSIATNYLLEDDKWDLLTQYAPVVEPLISQCLVKEGHGDLLAGVGLDEAYDKTLGMIKETIAKVPTEARHLDEEGSEMAQKYLQAAASFGSLVVADDQAAPTQRKNVFPEFLKSGLQTEDVKLGGQIVHGLAKLEQFVPPWKLRALHPDEELDDAFVIGEANPLEADSKYIEWLAAKSELMGNGTGKDMAEKDAEDFRDKTKNGIWWLQQKQKLLNLKYPCDAGSKESTCSFEEMFGLVSAQRKTSKLYTTQLAAGTNYLDVSACFSNAVSTAIRVLNEKIVYPIESLRESLNCRFLRRNVVQVAVVACDTVVSQLYYGAVYRALGGAFAYLAIIVLVVLWCSLRGSKGSSSVKQATANV
ncbi:hypothetical protein Efla_001326 [Eimeria flavescens]